jgi:DNA recombination protein Rad52
MSEIADIRKQLDEWIPKDQVSKRKGSNNMELSYIEGHEVVRQLNRIIGQGLWQYQIKELRTVCDKQVQKKDYKTGKDRTANVIGMLSIVELTVKIGESSVTFSDVGNGKGIDYADGLDAYESAAKEAVTDSFKRAAKNLGERLGLCLYDKEIRASIENGETNVEVAEEPAAEAAKAAPTGTTLDLVRQTFKVAEAKRKLTKAQVVAMLEEKYKVSNSNDLN